MRQKRERPFYAVSPIRLFLILTFCISLSLQTAYAAPRELIPVGQTVGITLDTDGLLVLGIGSVDGEENQNFSPCKGILQPGDLLLKANGKELENKETFTEVVEQSEGGLVKLRLQRNGKEKEVSVTPQFSVTDNAYRIGAWIRDSIQGIGTVTWYDPETETFGALGHGVYDVDTGGLMQMRNGALTSVELTEIVRGKKGEAGKLMGQIDLQDKLARIDRNTEMGIFGSGDAEVFAGRILPVAEWEDLRRGRAFLLSDLEGGEVKAYEIAIEGIRKNGGKDHKDMTIRITDERLLKLTGGIVQGLSGSPIVQDGKLVGAVTYVLLDDPAKGYGIFVGSMAAQGTKD